jgi:hypothetical protein
VEIVVIVQLLPKTGSPGTGTGLKQARGLPRLVKIITETLLIFLAEPWAAFNIFVRGLEAGIKQVSGAE